MSLRGILGVVLALAASDVTSSETELASVKDASCTLIMTANTRWEALVVRVQPPVPENCGISEGSLAQLLDSAFSTIDAAKGTIAYSSISLGRLVAYPRMSEALAVAASKDKGWDKLKGRSINGNDNKAVSRLLANGEIMSPLTKIINRWGYNLRSVSVEKVLVATYRDIPHYAGPKLDGKVPFDAQVWLRLERK